jgi:hypothetical protein
VRAALLAGAAYFAALFGTGTAFGVARELYVAPLFSPLTALLLELPMILAVAYVVCSWIADYLQVGDSWTDNVAMGATTLALLVAGDVALSLFLPARPGMPVAGAWAPALGFAAQAVASALPLLRRGRRPSSQ